MVIAAVWPALGVAGCSAPLPSSYFRVTAHLMHRDEPVTLDWVVECRYAKLVGDMVGVRGAVVPYVFGVATHDGGMVLMVAPNACGLRELDRTNLPFFMWGDRAGDFGFFTAYVTRHAFADRAAQIKVLDVEVRPSDRAEHDSWARTAPKNVVPEHPDPFRQDMTGKSSQCLGFVEVLVPPAFADEVRRLRPAGEPRYWLAPEKIGTEVAACSTATSTTEVGTPLKRGRAWTRWPSGGPSRSSPSATGTTSSATSSARTARARPTRRMSPSTSAASA